MKLSKIKNSKGLTLIELLIALVMGAFLIAGIYRTFVGQQRTYVVQEQVVDMQQNVRAAINKMVSEIRMAGFGNINLSNGVNGFTNIITPGENTITILGAFEQISTLEIDAKPGQNTITLANATNASESAYISIGGIESNIVTSITGNVLNLQNPLTMSHPANTPIFQIYAITYEIRQKEGKLILYRNEKEVAEGIENLRFEYFDSNGNLTTSPANIRMVRVTVTARTERPDPDPESKIGYRRRTITTNIHIRNMEAY